MADCIFCKISKKEIPSSLVYEDDEVFAFNDLYPQAPVHILIIPKKHISGIIEVRDYQIVGSVYKVINQLAKEKGIDQTGYRVVVNQGRDSGQAVFHLHFHLLGGRSLHWPPG